jgi:ribosomal protein L44E
MNKKNQEQEEREFKRKALGVVDAEKEQQLMQGPFKPNRALLTRPFSYPHVITSYCKKCGDHALITNRGVGLLEMLIEIYGLEMVVPKDLNGYFVEMEVCPECKTESERMYFLFRKLKELEE